MNITLARDIVYGQFYPVSYSISNFVRWSWGVDPRPLNIIRFLKIGFSQLKTEPFELAFSIFVKDKTTKFSIFNHAFKLINRYLVLLPVINHLSILTFSNSMLWIEFPLLTDWSKVDSICFFSMQLSFNWNKWIIDALKSSYVLHVSTLFPKGETIPPLFNDYLLQIIKLILLIPILYLMDIPFSNQIIMWHLCPTVFHFNQFIWFWPLIDPNPMRAFTFLSVSSCKKVFHFLEIASTVFVETKPIITFLLYNSLQILYR